MLFNSLIFILAFLPLALAGYFLLNRQRLTVAANAWLLFASLFFYGWWDLRYLPLILGSILFNYTIGGLLTENEPPRKRAVSRSSIFFTGLAINLLFLGYFKYTDFFIDNLNLISGGSVPLLHVILPLGISFFTITQIAFLVDCYEGLVEERNLLNYALFVTFFPHLLAGPILHHQEMMPQFASIRSKALSYRNMARGLLLFFIGLSKKVLIADNLMPIVKKGFDTAQDLNVAEAWLASLCYTFQLYFDFSGYSDMALGIGLMFNILLPVNFNTPYRATSIIDFWQRWHMTLTNFITTYLYTPILRAFSRVTFTRSLQAVFLAMFISGIWHGAGWTFVIWGSLHGSALAINHWWRKRRFRMPAPLAWLLTFMFVNTAFVYFRAKTVDDAHRILNSMAGLGAKIPAAAFEGFTVSSLFGRKMGTAMFATLDTRYDMHWLVLLLFLLSAVYLNSNQFVERFRPSRWTCLGLFVFAGYLLMNLSKVSEFIYFQF